jgi:phospholipid/cholesterol/gamma-HCH transport system substrate-binding protein
MNQETKVGLFLIAAVAVIASSAVFLGNIRLFKNTDRFYVTFQNVEALPPKAAVKIAGVEVGSVKRVELEEGEAKVTLDVEPEITIYKDARAKVGSTGIIGTKFIELNPGTPAAGELEPDSTIRGDEGGGLTQMAEKLSRLFERHDKYGDAIENLQESIAHIRNVTRALDVAIGNHASEMEEIVLNVKEITESAKVFTAHIEEITTENKEDVKVALEKFRSVGEKLDVLMTKIHEGKGVMGALVSDEKAGQEVREAVTSIKDTAASAKKVLGRFTVINTYWNYRYRYDFRDEESRSDLGVKFVPRPGKFYAFGITNLGEVPSGEKHNAFERKNRLVAVLGSDYGPFTGYAGAIQSRGGFGLDFRPFFWNRKLDKRVKLNVEAADFSRDRLVQGVKLDSALVSAGGNVAVTRWLSVGARWQDILERSAFQAYANIIFRDEDLSYLFGFASFAR